ncbi:DegT/DnrJ/EryC1/StrS aminotransferase family protein [Candidatus Pelagibacter ubique]|nr:DegT/DnrJ/EryC1/StrS aminotransferase family protein [Candidatus Pelagibacter ubique]
MQIKIPMYWPLQENVISKSERKKLSNFVLNTNRFTQFKEVSRFERLYSKWQNCKYSVFVNSGSSANLIIIQSAKEIYKWKDNDEVLVPSLTWPTTVTPVIQSGLKPVFVDCNLSDFSFDYDDLKKKITKKTKAIFVAHIIGFPADVKKIKKIIKNRKIILLEDSCESQGASINKIKVGNHGLASSFSFYWGHHLTTIEGGMISTNDRIFYNTCLLKRSHGLARELPKQMHAKIKKENKNIDFKFLFLNCGFNFRNTEINAYLGRFQLPQINNWIKIRNTNYNNFYKICLKYKSHFLLTKIKGMSSFVLPFIFKRKEIKIKFEKLLIMNGIETRPFIAGNLLEQPFLRKYKTKKLPNASFLHSNSFYIGNNQFVDEIKLNKLQKLMYLFFNERS